jgi:hypothetical protein
MKIFLAFPFRQEDKGLVSYIEQLLASQFISIITGERLGGEQLTPAVQARIDQAHGLVGLLTRRDQKVEGGWTTHQWVLDEIAYARAQKKRVIALAEDGVDVGGMYQSHECIQFKRDNLVEALLVLSEQVGLWKKEFGRTVKVQILPESLAKKIGTATSNIRCRHRLCFQGRYTEWRDVTPVPEPGGTFIYVEGVEDDHLVQIRVEDERKIWQSPATSQWMQVQLSSGGADS